VIGDGQEVEPVSSRLFFADKHGARSSLAALASAGPVAVRRVEVKIATVPARGGGERSFGEFQAAGVVIAYKVDACLVARAARADDAEIADALTTLSADLEKPMA
jgi:hypothetical protein